MSLPFKRIARVALRCADLDATAQAYSRFFGVREWAVRERELIPTGAGETQRYASAIGHAGPVGFELITPLDDHGVLADAFATRGPGISHLVVEAADPHALAAPARALGVRTQAWSLAEGPVLTLNGQDIPGHLPVWYATDTAPPAPDRVLRLEHTAVLPVQRLYQVSVIVPDLAAARARYEAVLGIEAWVEFPLESGPGMPEPQYYGRVVDHSARIAIGRRADACIELIQPVSGPTVYRDAFERCGETPHHIMATICPPAQFETAAATLAREGIVVGQRAAIPTLMQFAYFDASGPMAGLFIEVISPLADDWLARMFPDPAIARIVTG